MRAGGSSVRTTLLSGAVLTLGSIVLIMLSSGLGLDVETVALMGAGSGAAVALMPHRSPQLRLAGFLIGFVFSWLGYLVRAGFLPDTASGHAIAVGLVVALCSIAAAVSRDRIPLWGALLGAAVFAGSFETTYIEAPSQVLSNSVSTSTSVLLAFAFGFFAAALVAPQTIGNTERADDVPTPRAPQTEKGAGETSLGPMMKEDAP
jgi:hypothetical protein